MSYCGFQPGFLNTGSKVTNNPNSQAAPKPQVDTIKEITSLTREQIDLFEGAISWEIVEALGSQQVAKAIVLIIAKKKQPNGKPISEVERNSLIAVKMLADQLKLSLKDEQKGQMSLELIRRISPLITKAFAMPAGFNCTGWSAPLSEFECIGILKDAAKETGIELSMANVPPKLSVCLQVNQELTSQNSKLTFTLTMKSYDVIISTDNFTVSDLEKRYSCEF